MKFDRMSWILGIILGLLLMDIFYIGSKKILQNLITVDYCARYNGIKPDKWYWADAIYLNYFGGDYSFFDIKGGNCK